MDSERPESVDRVVEGIRAMTEKSGRSDEGIARGRRLLTIATACYAATHKDHPEEEHMKLFRSYMITARMLDDIGFSVRSFEEVVALAITIKDRSLKQFRGIPVEPDYLSDYRGNRSRLKELVSV